MEVAPFGVSFAERICETEERGDGTGFFMAIDSLGAGAFG
jgi:hypothetical protein